MNLKIILLLFPIISFSQLSPKVESLYNHLNSKNGMEARAVGYDGHTSEVFRMYAELDSIATDDEAYYMAQNGNNVVKGYLSNVLVNRKSKHLADLFSDYIKNDAEVHIQTGCMGHTSSIAGELYSSVFHQNQKIEEIKFFGKEYTVEEMKEYGLDYETKWTKPEVDSLLSVLNKITLTNDDGLPVTLAHIFALNKFEFGNYERIKFFAYKYPRKEILATLASFQNKNDLPLLHQNMDEAYLAISKFPDKTFIPELKARIKKVRFDYYFLDAVAGFKTKDAEELVSMVLSEFEANRDEKREFDFFDSQNLYHFYNCLEKNDSVFANNFLLKMWIDNRIISFTYFERIKNTHYNEILKGYLNPLPFTSTSINEDSDLKQYTEEQINGYLCPHILDYLKSNATRNKDKSVNLATVECKG